jgi:hypothetical protein
VVVLVREALVLVLVLLALLDVELVLADDLASRARAHVHDLRMGKDEL